MGMDIKEAIQHAREVTKRMEEEGKCKECAEEHIQLADWLEQLEKCKKVLEKTGRLTKKIGDMVWLRCKVRDRDLFLEPHEIATSQNATSYVREMLVLIAEYEDILINKEN